MIFIFLSLVLRYSIKNPDYSQNGRFPQRIEGDVKYTDEDKKYDINF